MNHDFSKAHGGTNDQYTAKNACNNQGFMSYGDHKSEWSECSVKDFTAWYNTNKENWCMPGKAIRNVLLENAGFWNQFRVMTIIIT